MSNGGNPLYSDKKPKAMPAGRYNAKALKRLAIEGAPSANRKQRRAIKAASKSKAT